MRDDDEVVSRCLPQQAIVRSTLAEGVFQPLLLTPLIIIEPCLKVYMYIWTAQFISTAVYYVYCVTNLFLFINIHILLSSYCNLE